MHRHDRKRCYRHNRWPPSALEDKCLILKVWIAPCCHLEKHTHFPIPHVLSQLNMILRVALRLTSLGLTKDILLAPEAMGGFGQAGIGTYALCTDSKSVVQYLATQSSVPSTLSEGFGRWVHSQGLVGNEVTLPCIQLAPSSAQLPGFVGWSLRACSLVKRRLPPAQPTLQGCLGAVFQRYGGSSEIHKMAWVYKTRSTKPPSTDHHHNKILLSSHTYSNNTDGRSHRDQRRHYSPASKRETTSQNRPKMIGARRCMPSCLVICPLLSLFHFLS